MYIYIYIFIHIATKPVDKILSDNTSFLKNKRNLEVLK